MSGAPLPAHPAFARVRHWLVDATGMAFLAGRDEVVAGALERRLEALGLPGLDAYEALLAGDGGTAEREALVSAVTIGETYFFRFRAQWDAFTDLIVPDLLARKRAARRLRVWCAGCSSGAEPYTAAILLRDRFRAALEGWDVRILGTDINRRFLGEARRARFGAWSFRATPDAVRDRHFLAKGREWELRPEYRSLVEFQYHNLVADRPPFPPDDPPDLVFCRNVLIYFDAPTIRRVVRGFEGLLPEGGWLLLGHAESDAATAAGLEPVSLPEATLFRKGAPAPHRPATRPVPRAAAPPAPRPAATPSKPAPLPPRRAPFPIPAPPPAPAPGPAAETQATTGRRDDILETLARGELGRAMDACLGWLAEAPLDPWAHLTLATLFRERADDAAAEGALRKALYLDRGLLLAHYDLACVLRRHNPGAARRGFATVLSLAAARPGGEPVPGTPGMTVADLRHLAHLWLDRLPPP